MLTKRVFSYQDNVRQHIANFSTKLINQFGWDIAIDPPYSSDIALSNYHLFSEIKKLLGGMHFTTEEKLKEDVLSFLCSAVREFCDSSIKKIVHRMRKCIKLKGII